MSALLEANPRCRLFVLAGGVFAGQRGNADYMAWIARAMAAFEAAHGLARGSPVGRDQRVNPWLADEVAAGRLRASS